MNTTPEFQKRLAVAKRLRELKAPCGCVPKLAKCKCDGACECDLELDFCDHAEDWPIEFIDRLGDWMAETDPAAYADGPLPPTQVVMTNAQAKRLIIYETRAEGGYRLWHPDDSTPDRRKNGETLSRNRNGSIRHSDTEDAPEVNRMPSQWRGGEARISISVDSYSSVIEDLVTSMEGWA